ncbi:hypothetical protein [Hwangdonia sp.]|uniref:hypothetical protein n=1 Tax=Hwangdonia sp. TaxID=1883432 RepID=UPI003AB8CD21
MRNTLTNINIPQYRGCLSLVLLLLPILFLHAQNTSDQLANQLHEVSKKHALESVYVQSSKGIYETGEDLWFKGYVLNSQHLSPSTQSKTLYVQLIESKTEKAVWEEKYEIENGFVNGHIYVQDTLREGRYTLAAYTRYSFYDDKQPIKSIRQLQIVENITKYHQSKKQDTLIKAKPKEAAIDFQLFPEGGCLVSGITSTIAFKTVDTLGMPKSVSGTLYENNVPITKIKTVHAGMGRFNFTPDVNKRYHIVLDSLTTKKQYTLPTIKADGSVLQLVSNTKDHLTLKVSKSTSQKETLYLRVQVRGVAYSVAQATITKERLIKIPLNDIPQGIAEVTLFNQEFEPVAERLVYMNQDQKLNIKAVLDKGEYLTKGNAKLKLKVTDQHNNPVIAHLGLSVFDDFYNNPKDTKTIETHYHLSAQLKGRIYNPSYYFNSENANRHQALDLLLLTQGWRCYKWNEENLKSQNQLKTALVTNGIEGKFTYIKKGKNSPEQSFIIAYDPFKEEKKSIIPIDTNNRFVLTPSHLKISRRLFIKHFGTKKDKILISVKDPFLAINSIKKLKDFGYPIAPVTEKKEVNESKTHKWQSIKDAVKLDEIQLVAKKKGIVKRDKYLAKLDSLAKLEMTGGDYVCTKDNYLNCPIHLPHKYSKNPVEGEVYLELQIKDGGQWVTGVAPVVGQVFRNPKLPAYRYPKLTDEYLLEKFNIIKAKGYYTKKRIL